MDAFIKKLSTIRAEAKEAFEHAPDEKALETLRLTYWGKQGILSKITDEFSAQDLEKKRSTGAAFSTLKTECHTWYQEAKKRITLSLWQQEPIETFDPGLEKDDVHEGRLHYYSKAAARIETFFDSMGYVQVQGTIIESEFYNFTALNIPESHPARSDMDTFYLDVPGLVLRTHTSAVQVKEAKKRTPPFGIYSFGPVYRNEATDASHDVMFYQLECLYLTTNVSVGNLLSIIQQFLTFFFEKTSLNIQVRPGPFPFVCPGLEVDCQCPFCETGCSVCKHSRWIEICGCGMVHPSVITHMGYQSEQIKGFAFGFGLTRLVMLKYHINDIRLLHGTSHS